MSCSVNAAADCLPGRPTIYHTGPYRLGHWLLAALYLRCTAPAAVITEQPPTPSTNGPPTKRFMHFLNATHSHPYSRKGQW